MLPAASKPGSVTASFLLLTSARLAYLCARLARQIPVDVSEGRGVRCRRGTRLRRRLRGSRGVRCNSQPRLLEGGPPGSPASSDAAALPGRVLLQRVVHDVVVQERQVVVEGDWSAAGAGGRVLVQLFVMREVVEDFVIVCLGLRAGAAAVPEDQLLFSLVPQPQIRHVEVHLL